MIYMYGFNKISLNKILKEAKVSKGSFYHQFNDFDDLINQVFDKITTLFFEDFSFSNQKMDKNILKKSAEK